MKKFISIFTMLLCIIMVSAAERPFELVEGDIAAFKGAGNIEVTFDFDDATYDMQEPISVHYATLDDMLLRVPPYFKHGYQKKAKRSKVVYEEDNPQYLVVIKITNVKYNSKVLSVGSSNNTALWGTITFKDKATGATVLVLNINGCAGGHDFSADQSFIKSFQQLGEDFGKLQSKGIL